MVKIKSVDEAKQILVDSGVDVIMVSDSLNGWTFPEELKMYEESGRAEKLKEFYMGVAPQSKFINEFLDTNNFRMLYDASEELTTKKQRLRYHWLNNLDKSEEEFNEWWEGVK